MLNNTEKIENVLYVSGKFRILHTILFGNKRQNNSRLDPIYQNEYNSKKYIDRAKLTNTTINSNNYVVLSYKDFSDRNNIVTEEVFISYPHLSLFKQYLNDMAEEIFNNYDNYYTETEVAESYKNKTWTSGNMAGGKILICNLEKSDEYQTGVFQAGINMYLSDSIGIFMDLNQLLSIIDRLNEFNLSIESSILINTQIQLELYSMIERMGGTVSSGVQSPRRNVPPSLGKRPSGSSTFKNRGVSKTSPSRRFDRNTANSVSIDGTDKVEVDISDEFTLEPEKEPVTQAEKNGNMNFQSLIQAADKVDMDDILE